MSFVNTDHLGWLICKNDDTPYNPDLPRALDTTKYNLLFQVIGYTFGGSGNTFHLPHMTGRVMGTVGKVTDSNGHIATYVATSSKVGEIDHKLVQSEMPSHNHNNLVGIPAATNTALEGTTSSYNHSHGGTTGVTSSSTGSVSVLRDITNVGPYVATSSGDHSHSISADIHSHTIASNGGDLFHNNIQPTLFYGNTFIYCGIPMMGEFPFKTGLAPVLI